MSDKVIRAAGFGYTIFHEGLNDYSYPVGYDEFSGHISSISQPLVQQPGEGWVYGVRHNHDSQHNI